MSFEVGKIPRWSVNLLDDDTPLRNKIFEADLVASWATSRSLAVNSVGFIPPKTNMDTQNNGPEKLNIAMFGIYVRFRGCNWAV